MRWKVLGMLSLLSSQAFVGRQLVCVCVSGGGWVGNVLFECKPRSFTLRTGALLSRH